MRIAVTGASGMLGTALIDEISNYYDIFATSRSLGLAKKNITWNHFDLLDFKKLKNWLNKVNPDVVIHCAAITDVDFCEKNPKIATLLHIQTTEIICGFCELGNKRMIYISTDSVFDGKKDRKYSETDIPNPLNIYSKTKYIAEKKVLSMNIGLVLRVNIVGLTKGKNNSFSDWLLDGLISKKNLNLFDDVYFSPLHVNTLASVLKKIVSNPIFGVYHCASNDYISKYEFGKKMAKIFDLPDSGIKKVSIDSMNFKALRPKNMALNIEKMSSSLEYDLPSSVEAIILLKYQYNN